MIHRDPKATRKLISPGDPTHGLAPEPGSDEVDVTLIRWMLSLTPSERLQVLQEHVEAVLRLRSAKSES